MTSDPSGALPENILYFARALREAGLPVGPASVMDAIAAAQAAGLGNRADFRAALHAVLVKKHENTVIFDQAFEIFWRKRGYMDKLIAMLSPMAEPKNAKKQRADAGATRVADALFKHENKNEKPAPSLDLDARFTTSQDEILQGKDFAQMNAAEIARARDLIARLKMSEDEIVTRRFRADSHGSRVDLRRTFRQSIKAGGAVIDLAFRARATKHPPIVAICDISGSMSDYTRIFLHFLHVMTAERSQVHTFLFGTRLTNVTRALRHKDIDEAMAQCSLGVRDWAGGTRIGPSLHDFNRLWSRRVLGGGATVILFTDGLEREGTELLVKEMERLHKSCRRLVWVNPLLRFDGFSARAQGIRAMLGQVDEFRPIHNLASMADLCAALGGRTGRIDSPRLWLQRAA